jgi:hypothetical protein
MQITSLVDAYFTDVQVATPRNWKKHSTQFESKHSFKKKQT